MRLLKILGLFFLIIILVLLSLPTLLSTQKGKTLAVDFLNKQIPGKIEIGTLDLNWFSQSRIHELELKDAEGKRLAFVEKATLFNSLWKLLTSPNPEPVIDISNLNATIIADKNGTTNLERALYKPSFEKPRAQELAPIELVNTHVKSEINKESIQLETQGSTFQNGVKGAFHVDGSYGRIFSLNGSFNDFPSLILDQVATLADPKYKGVLIDLLGPKLTVNAKAENNLWSLDVKSGNLQGVAEGKMASDDWLLTKPAHFVLNLTPSAANILTDGKLLLTKPSRLDIQIDNFHPVNEWIKGYVEWTDISLLNGLSLSEVNADFNPLKAEIHAQGPTLTGSAKINFDHEFNIKHWNQQSGKGEFNFQGYDLNIAGTSKFGLSGIEVILNGVAKGTQFQNLTLTTTSELPKDISNLYLKGTVSAESVKSVKGELKNLQVPFEWDSKNDAGSATLTGTLSPQYPLKGDIRYKRGNVVSNVEVTEFPLSLLLTPNSPALKELANTTASISNESEFTTKGFGKTRVNIATQDFDLKGRIRFSNWSELELDGEPITLNLHVTPERLKTLSSNRLTSDRKLQAIATIENLKLANPIEGSSFNLKISSQPIQVKNLNDGRTLSLQSINGNVNSANLAKQVDFSIHEAQGSGILDITGTVAEPFSEAPGIQLSLDAENFPTAILAAAFPPEKQMESKLYALLGSSFNADIKANIQKMNGPVQASIKGSNFNVNLDGQVKNAVLTLTTPLIANLNLSKEVGDAILNTFVPLLNSANRADQPLKLTINPNGFQLPLKDFSLANTQIPSGSVELNRIYFTKEGKLAQILNLLNFRAGNEFSVWFTPLYFKLENGLFQLYRLDMLVADQYPIATWGNINFVEDYVNMQVGLTGKSIAMSLGPLPLPKSYMLNLPLRGPLSNPRLDMTRVAAKLSSLAAMVTGPQGIIVGALIDLASGAMADPVPEPTTKPLPWDVDAPVVENQEGQNPYENNPVGETIQKGAKKLFDSLFK